MKISMLIFNYNNLITNMKHIVLTLSLLMITFMSFAQKPNNGQKRHERPNMEKFLEDRTNFVVSKMKLSAEDSIKFVPIYKEKLKAKGELMMKSRPPHIIPGQEYADSVYMKAVELETNYKIEDAKIDEAYNKKFAKILSAKQLFIYLQAEKMFVGSFMHRNRPHKGDAKKD